MSESHVSIVKNVPLQLVIIIASVILIATLLASLAWICCTRNRRKAQEADLLAGRQAVRKNSFSPNNPGSVYDFQDANSIDGLSLQEKSDYSSSIKETIVCMPVLPSQALDPHRLERPQSQSHVVEQHQNRGWQQNQDIEGGNGMIAANGDYIPARRPSFIDRLLAHRNVNQSNAVKLGSGTPIMRSERSVTTPAIAPAFTANQTIDAPQNAMFTAIGGAFRTLSQHHPYHSRRKYVPSPRQYTIESDYEGTIGRRDSELPMAQRANERRSFGAETIASPRTVNDRMSHQPGFTRSALIGPREMTGSRQPALQRPSMSASQLVGSAAHTPGLAGVGATWQQTDEGASKPVSQKTREAQGKLSTWVLESKYAAIPPPESSSRRASQVSFIMSERSLPSVSRQNSMLRTISSTARGSPSMRVVPKVAGQSPSSLQHEIITAKLKNALTQRGSLLAEEAENDIISARRATFVEHTVAPVKDTGAWWQDIQFAEATPVLPETPRDDEAQRILQKKMRKRIRKARKAAQKAAKEAALLEAERRASSTSLGESIGLKSTEGGAIDVGVSQNDWVKQLLMVDSPQVQFQPASASAAVPSTTTKRSNSTLSMKRKQVPRMIETNRRASSGSILRRQVSPPESPLTSASEGESCDAEDYLSAGNKHRSVSAPLHRSFLVESRRTSQDAIAEEQEPTQDPPIEAGEAAIEEKNAITATADAKRLIDSLAFESASSDDAAEK